MALSRELKPKLELAEGKTTEDKAGKKPICQGCDINEATLFCQACFEDLCDTCSRSHAKYLGPDHVCGKLSDKSMMVSKLVPKSAEESPETSECVHHLGTEVSRICRQCRVLVCRNCVHNGHKGHDVVPFENAASLLMEICNQDVKLLLDALTNVHNVGSDRDSALSIDNAIQQLKQKQNDLFKMITEHVTKSIARMEEEKERFVKRATEVEEMATVTAERMEFNITQLNTARKGRDINSMVAEICRCDHIMNDVRKFVDVVGQSKSESYTVEDVAPRLREYDARSREMVTVFDIKLHDVSAHDIPMRNAPKTMSILNTTEETNKTRSTKFDYKRLTKQRTIKMKKRDGKICYYSYAKVPLHFNSFDRIAAYECGLKQTILLNCFTGAETQSTSECYINMCINLSKRYVAASLSDINLLDTNFALLNRVTLPKSSLGMCCLGETEFLVYMQRNAPPHHSFSVFQIINDKITFKNKVTVEEQISKDKELQFCGICPTPFKNKVILVFAKKGESLITAVNLETGSISKYIIAIEVWRDTPYVDKNGDLLVYTRGGVIHLYRDIVNGVNDTEVLTNIKASDSTVLGIFRDDKNLILGYYQRVEHYSI